MTTLQKTNMYSEISIHGENLNRIFSTGLDPVTLSKKLHSLEIRAHALTLTECNTGKSHKVELSAILTKVKMLLCPDNTNLSNAIFINGDARGYALKIKDDYVRKHNLTIYRDWGGYGILAPDFTP